MRCHSHGVGGRVRHRAGRREAGCRRGAFYLPDGGYDLNGQMAAGQLKYALPVKKSQLIGATGLHYLHGESGANNLRNRNGERDYLLGTGSLQWGPADQGLPADLGADVFYNFVDYDAGTSRPSQLQRRTRPSAMCSRCRSGS